jgi:hypothetical protein
MTYLAVVFAASQWLSWTLPQDFADRGTTFLYRSKDGMSLCRRSGSYKVSGRSLDDFEVLNIELPTGRDKLKVIGKSVRKGVLLLSEPNYQASFLEQNSANWIAIQTRRIADAGYDNLFYDKSLYWQEGQDLKQLSEVGGITSIRFPSNYSVWTVHPTTKLPVVVVESYEPYRLMFIRPNQEPLYLEKSSDWKLTRYTDAVILKEANVMFIVENRRRQELALLVYDIRTGKQISAVAIPRDFKLATHSDYDLRSQFVVDKSHFWLLCPSKLVCLNLSQILCPTTLLALRVSSSTSH